MTLDWARILSATVAESPALPASVTKRRSEMNVTMIISPIKQAPPVRIPRRNSIRTVEMTCA